MKNPPAVILRTTQRIEHLTRRITNLLNWPGDKVTPPDAQKFTEEALQQLPEIMRELRRRSESFRLEEIEEAMTKLNISPTLSPTQEQQTGAVKFQEYNIDPVKERLTDRQVNIQPVNVTLLPNELENMTSTYELPPHLPTNQSAEKPRMTTQLNLTTELYGKITHPVERILSEIPTTDGPVSYTHLDVYKRQPLICT